MAMARGGVACRLVFSSAFLALTVAAPPTHLLAVMGSIPAFFSAFFFFLLLFLPLPPPMFLCVRLFSKRERVWYGCRIPFGGSLAAYIRKRGIFSGADWPNLSGTRACRLLISISLCFVGRMGMFNGSMVLLFVCVSI